MTKHGRLPAIALVALASSGLALAGGKAPPAQFEFSRPTRAGIVLMQFERNGVVVAEVAVAIPGNAPPSAKRDLIQDALGREGYDVEGVGEAGLAITPRNNEFDRVIFAPGDTGEERDTASVTGAAAATARFEPDALFEPIVDDRDAVFRAGFFNDLGGIEVALSARDLDYVTDGRHIMEALHAQLAPQAPDYGVRVSLDDDGLHFAFDESLTRERGGIVFGTSSPTPGCSGGISVPAALNRGPLGGKTESGPSKGVKRTKIKDGTAEGDEFCVYTVAAILGGSDFRVGDVICVNCPDGDCPTRATFLYTDADGNQTWGWWSRSSFDRGCEDCPSDGAKGYVFEE